MEIVPAASVELGFFHWYHDIFFIRQNCAQLAFHLLPTQKIALRYKLFKKSELRGIFSSNHAETGMICRFWFEKPKVKRA